MSSPNPPAGDASAEARRLMVARQLRARGLDDPVIEAAFLTVPRELFVPARLAARAYDDSPLPIESGQTISQPYIVALMIAAVAIGPDDRVLEIGAGSGYAAAILGQIAARVDAVERHAGLVRAARERLAALGCDNVHVHLNDGRKGWPEAAPYDAVIVSAAAADPPPALMEQLAPGGRLVIPVGGPDGEQRLRLVTLADGGPVMRDLGPVRFVPLLRGLG